MPYYFACKFVVIAVIIFLIVGASPISGLWDFLKIIPNTLAPAAADFHSFSWPYGPLSYLSLHLILPPYYPPSPLATQSSSAYYCGMVLNNSISANLGNVINLTMLSFYYIHFFVFFTYFSGRLDFMGGTSVITRRNILTANH